MDLLGAYGSDESEAEETTTSQQVREELWAHGACTLLAVPLRALMLPARTSGLLLCVTQMSTLIPHPSMPFHTAGASPPAEALGDARQLGTPREPGAEDHHQQAGVYPPNTKGAHNQRPGTEDRALGGVGSTLE